MRLLSPRERSLDLNMVPLRSRRSQMLMLPGLRPELVPGLLVVAPELGALTVLHIHTWTAGSPRLSRRSAANPGEHLEGERYRRWLCRSRCRHHTQLLEE